MADYNIISPLVVTSDNRGANQARGLGNTPVNPVAAAVEGLESGVSFGFNLGTSIQANDRANDPDKLAAEQLRRELDNESIALANKYKTQYGGKQIESDLSSEAADREYKGALTQRLKNEAAGIYTPEQQLRLQVIKRQLATADATLEKAKNSASGKKGKRLSPEQEQDWLQGKPIRDDADSADAPDSSAVDDAGYDAVPTIPKAAPQAPRPRMMDPQVTNAGTLGYLNSSTTQGKESKAQFAQRVVKSIVGGAQKIPASDGKVYGAGWHEPDGSFNLDLPEAVDPDSSAVVDAPTAFATLTNLTNLHKTADPEEAAVYAKAIGVVLDKVPMDEMQDFIDASGEKNRPFLKNQRDSAAAILATQGNPQYLSPTQKAIQAAKMPFSSLVDPDGTINEAMSVLTDGYAATDNMEFKTALRGNQHFAAYAQASNNGQQGVTVREILTPPSDTTSPDITNPTAPPPTTIVYEGDDGTKAYAPSPVVDPDNPDPKAQFQAGQASFVDALAKKHRETVDLNKGFQNNIDEAKAARDQGAFQGKSSYAANPNAGASATQEGPFEPDRGGTTPRGVRLSPMTDFMEDEYAADYRKRNIPTSMSGVDKANEKASAYAAEKIKQYNKETKPLLDNATKADTEAAQVKVNTEKLQGLLQEAQEKGYTDLFGPGEVKRLRREAIMRLPMGAEGNDEARFLRDYDQLVYEQMRGEVKGAASTMNSAVEQKLAIRALPAIDMDFDSVVKLATKRAEVATTSQNVSDLTRELQSRGHHLKRAGIERITSEYLRSGAATPGNENYLPPEEYLYSAPKTKEQKNLPAAGNSGNVPPPPTGGGSSMTNPKPFSPPSPTNAADISGPGAQGDVVGAQQTTGEAFQRYAYDQNPELYESGMRIMRDPTSVLPNDQKKSPPPVDRSLAQIPGNGPLDAIIPSWLTTDNFKRGMGLMGAGAEKLVTDPVGSAQELATGTKNLIIGSDAERAHKKQELVVARSEQDPEFRAQVESIKKDIQNNPKPKGMMDAAGWVFEAMTPPAIRRMEKQLTSSSYDAVINKVQKLVGVSDETIDQRQFERDAARTAKEEIREDEKIESPWSNAAAEATAFGILSWGTGVAGSAAKTGALKQLAKVDNPVVKEAIAGIEKLASPRWARWLASKAGTTARDATAYTAMQENRSTDEAIQNLETGSVLGVAGQLFGFMTGKAIDVGAKVANKVGIPGAARTAEKALAGEFSSAGVQPQSIEQSLSSAKKLGANPVGELDPNAGRVVQNVTATPEGQSVINQGAQAASRDAQRTSAEKAAGLAEGDLRPQPEITNDFRSKVGAMEEAQSQKAAQETLDVQNQARSQAQSTIDQSAIREAEAVNKITNDLVGKSEADAKTTTKALAELIEQKPVDIEGKVVSAQSPVEAIDTQLGTLKKLKKSLKDQYDPSFKALAEDMVPPSKEALDKLYKDLNKLSPSLTQDLLGSTNKAGGGTAAESLSLKGDFDYLDSLYKNIRTKKNSLFGAANKTEARVADQMTKKIGEFLDIHTSDPYASGSKTRYTELNKKYKAVRDVEDHADELASIFQDIKTYQSLANPPSRLENKFFGTTKGRLKMERLLGEDGAKSLRSQLRTADEARVAAKTGAKDFAKADKLEVEQELNPDFAAVKKLAGTNKNFAKDLLNSEDNAFVEQIKRGVTPENEGLIIEGVMREVKNRLRENKVPGKGDSTAKMLGLSEKQWERASQVLPEDTTRALDQYALRLKNIRNLEERISQEANTGNASGMRFPRSFREGMWKSKKMVVDLFAGTEFSKLSAAERKSVTKALTDLNPDNVEATLTKVVDIMKNPPKGFAETFKKYGSILAYGLEEYANAPSKNTQQTAQQNAKREQSLEKLRILFNN